MNLSLLRSPCKGAEGVGKAVADVVDVYKTEEFYLPHFCPPS